MHFRFARRTSAIRYYSLSRQILRGVLNFCNTAETSQFAASRNFPSLQITPSKVSAATLTARVITYCLRPSAQPRKTLLIVTFIFGAWSCAIRREIRAAYCHPLVSFSTSSYLFDACDMQGRHTLSGSPLPSKQREACKTTEGGRWYCRIFRYARWLARKENLSKGRVETDVPKSNDMFEKGCEQVNFIAYMHVYKNARFLFSWISLDNIGYYRRLKIVINYKMRQKAHICSCCKSLWWLNKITFPRVRIHYIKYYVILLHVKKASLSILMY